MYRAKEGYSADRPGLYAGKQSVQRVQGDRGDRIYTG